MTALFWFTRDLRVRDQPALRAALDGHDRVIPVFCFDDRLLGGRHASGPRTQFLLECLRELDGALRERGSGLVVRHGRPERELPRWPARTGASEIHCSADIGPFARPRRGARALEPGVELCAHPGLHAVDDLDELAHAAGTPYRVFTPFHRAWLERHGGGARRAARAAAAAVGLRKGRLPSLDGARARRRSTDPPPGGEEAAASALARFLDGRRREYADTTTRSARPHLAPVALPALRLRVAARDRGAAPARAGAEAFRRQLCWRDFHHHVLLHNPDNAHSRVPAALPRRELEPTSELFAAWCEGLTGYPLVDAGMRQLRREGWMHNRVRLVVGSFLTKDLGIDWRWGERWFMRWLVDGDEANNNGNWQWIASVGTDPQPVYRRIYNPARHRSASTPRAPTCGATCPSCARARRHLGEPWGMPEEVQRECGCVIGRDYPAPIVDHLQARREALERYRAAGG